VALRGCGGYLFLLQVFLRGRSLPTGYLHVYHNLVPAHPAMSDEGRSSRARDAPNAEMLKKAKTKYKTFNKEASTEYARLNTLNTKNTLTTFKNPAEHATFWHLNDLRMQGDDPMIFQFTFICLLSMTLIFAADKEADKVKAAKATASPRKSKRNEQGNYARFYSCASNLASILN
jgi:hypothetical protein